MPICSPDNYGIYGKYVFLMGGILHLIATILKEILLYGLKGYLVVYLFTLRPLLQSFFALAGCMHLTGKTVSESRTITSGDASSREGLGYRDMDSLQWRKGIGARPHLN
ncbi:hypothetical protein L6452_01341 [Arctium lappa]|uniref:Uncharacterized protein n=1 Tax=Arctium lappa TaxID=4217 RepID=A0ACB9FHP5_ARCLA|nr:hypothetical protein L6452_01341 [Arctium lappa]